MAGQESIAQAAGRGNREGKLEHGLVFVFDLPAAARGEQSRRRSACRAVIREGLPLLSPEASRCYFDELYSLQGEADLDQKNILRRVADRSCEDGYFPFRSVAHDFRFIDDDELPIIVPYGDEAQSVLESLRRGQADRAVYRRLQQWIVTVPDGQIKALLRAGSIVPVGHAEQFYELVNTDLYSGLSGEKSGKAEWGLDPDDPAFRDAEGLIQ
jgi:CRISPR-associated endonuclease/helicase Cas3